VAGESEPWYEKFFEGKTAEEVGQFKDEYPWLFKDYRSRPRSDRYQRPLPIQPPKERPKLKKPTELELQIEELERELSDILEDVPTPYAGGVSIPKGYKPRPSKSKGQGSIQRHPVPPKRTPPPPKRPKIKVDLSQPDDEVIILDDDDDDVIRSPHVSIPW
jgi:hypothetical protein